MEDLDGKEDLSYQEYPIKILETGDISYAAPHVYGSILQVSFLYFPKGGRISIMSKTNTESNSKEYY
jgi:hypothetical protein